MNCKICKTEISDDSIYCGMCGARVDGKKTCTVCKKEIEESYIYCNYCGARVDGKTVCECGNVYEGNFCPVCGKGVAKNVGVREKWNALDKGSVAKKISSVVKKIFSIIGGAAAATCALLALIFVFFIGFDLKIPVSLSETGIPLESTNINIYYFFGKYFREMEGVAQTAQYPWFQNLLSADVNVLGILGIIVCAFTLLSVVGCSVTALVLYLLGWFGKAKDSFEKWAVAATVCFVVGAAAIYGLNQASVSLTGQISSVSFGVNVSTVMNGATTAAVVLLAIFAGVFLLCSLVRYNWGKVTGKSVLEAVFSLVGVAFAIVLICAGANVAQYLEGGEDGVLMSMNIGCLQSNLLWTGTFSSNFVNTVEGYTQATEALMAMNVLNIVVQICMIAVLVLVGVILYKNFCAFEGGASSIVCSLVAFVLSIAVLVLSIVAFEKLGVCLEFVENDTVATSKYSSQIVTIVFTGLLLALSIVKKAFSKLKQE